MYVAQPLLPLLGREFGVSAAAAGATISAVALVVALTSSAYGPLTDALGFRTVMAGGCAALAGATLCCAFAPSFPALLALRALQGLFVPSVGSVAVAYLGELRGKGDPGALIGAYIGATVVGGLCGRVGGGLIAQYSGWRASFVAFAALTAAAALGLFLALRTAERSASRRSIPHAYRDMAAHFANSRLLGAFIVGATLFFGFMGIFTYLPYLLSAPPFSLSTGQISWFYASYAAGVFAAPLAGRLSLRMSRRGLIAGGFAVAIAGTLLMLERSLAVIAVGSVVLCTGMFVAQAIAPAYVNVTARTAKAGANSLYQAFYYTGAVLGATVPGLALERYGWPGVASMCAVSFTIGLVADVTLCARDSGSASAVAVSP